MLCKEKELIKIGIEFPDGEIRTANIRSYELKLEDNAILIIFENERETILYVSNLRYINRIWIMESNVDIWRLCSSVGLRFGLISFFKLIKSKI